MSSIALQHPATALHNLHFEQLFDKYGAAVYGFIAKADSMEAVDAHTLTSKIFSLMYKQQNIHLIKDNAAFVQLMRIMVIVMKEKGYLPCLPIIRHQLLWLKQMG